ncbi:MAG: TIGR00725 family protein [Candidatus Binataceae bacterium]
MQRRPAIAVIGGGDGATVEVLELAHKVGSEIGAHGATLICGGRGGVIEAAARGAFERGAHTIGILPGYEHGAANPHIEFAIATGMGEARNAVVIGSADAVIALAGEGGTLSEIGFALKIGRPTVALRAWPQIEGIEHADEPEAAVGEAVRMARLAAARQGRKPRRAKAYPQD